MSDLMEAAYKITREDSDNWINHLDKMDLRNRGKL